MTQEDLGIDLSGIYTGNLEDISDEELDVITNVFKYAMLNEGKPIYSIDGFYIREKLNEIL